MGKSFGPEMLEHARTVAARQSFGSDFAPRGDDEEVARRLRDGFVTLAPHPEVELARPVVWSQDPLKQRNWRAQLHMLRWLDPLRRLAAAGDPSFMSVWEEVARQWICENPPAVSTATYAWANMVDALRSQTLLLGLPYVQDPDWLLDSLVDHGEWLLDPSHLGHSNHALHQHAALFMLGCALREQGWIDEGHDRIVRHVSAEFDEQGVNREAAPGYWLLNYRWVRELIRRVELEGHDASAIRAAVERTSNALAHAARPDGALEIIGDTAPRTWLRETEGAPEVSYVATAGGAGSPPDSTVALFNAGYVFGRSGWGETERRFEEETFYSLRFGAADGVHGHADGGGVTYFSGGRPILTEAGKYAYLSDPARTYVTGRLGHNVVHVRDTEYDPASVVELVGYETNDRFDHFRLRDRGYRGVTIERAVTFARATEALLVVDTVRAVRPVTAEVRWHVDSRATARKVGPTVGIRNGPAEVTFRWSGRSPAIELVRGQVDPLDGWVSPRWGQVAETTVVKAVQSGTAFRVITSISPGSARYPRRPVGAGGSAGETAVVLDGHGMQEKVVIGSGSVTVLPVGHDMDDTAAQYRVPDSVPSTKEIERFESENVEARRELCSGRTSGPPFGSLEERIRRGHDYGAAATLVDAFGSGGRPGSATRLDPRTRRGMTISGHRAESPFGELVHYESTPSRFTLGSQRSTHVVEMGPVALPFAVQRAESDILVVSLHGALNRAKTVLPRFERLRSLGTMGVNALSVADPTLDLDPSLTLGWYLGTRSMDLHLELARVVETVSDQLGIRRVVFLGSSGGGFAALHLGSLVRGSTVLALNPQTDVRRYHARFSQRALQGVFGADASYEDGLRTRVSVAARFAKSGVPDRVRYVMNRGDVHHLVEHAEPLWAGVPELAARLEVTWLDLGNGHLSPDLETVTSVLTQEMER